MKYEEDGYTVSETAATGRRPVVFLIGDSIRLGYCAQTAAALRDEYETVYPAVNCRSSQFILMELHNWVTLCDPAQVRLVQFNCGHWDIAHWDGSPESLTSLEEYRRNLRAIIWKLRRLFPVARLVFASTSAMNPSGIVGRNPRTNAEIERYNSAAAEIMRAENIPVNDQYALTASFDSGMFADYCHLTEEGFTLLGHETAAFLRRVLSEA